MGEVIELRREEEGGSLVGPALCLGCGHEWVQVSSLGVVAFDCPECGTEKGVFAGLNRRGEDAWMCHCGGFAMYVTASGVHCLRCGVTQVFP
jgi:predicted RNA-binding Zn-ribbon protein involved in translation (DUF1610 family)